MNAIATHTDTQLGPYQVVERIHEGRLCALYRARQPGLLRDVAIKTVSPLVAPERREEARHALRREAELLAALEHPAFPSLYALDETSERPLLVTAWLPGGTVTERFRNNTSIPEVLELVRRVGEGLDALHQLGWIHGDLSPRNIVFDRVGAPRLIDLASAARIGERFDASEGRVTTALTGAPELDGDRAIDGRADTYALAVISYFLLTGAWPFVADERAQLRAKHAREPVAAPSTICPLLGPSVDAVLLRALAKQPDERHASASEFAHALAQALVPERAEAGASVGASLLGVAPREPGRLTSDAAVKRAYEAIERFAAQLPEHERAAFTALIGAVEQQDARSLAACGSQLRELVAPVAALQAAEQLGVLQNLAAGPQTIDALARACELPSDTLARLCEFLRALEVLHADDDARWRLRQPFAGAYGHGQRLGVGVHLVRDALAMWGQLPQWVRTREPAFAMDADVSGREYADGTAYLGDSSEHAAAELSKLLDDPTLVPERSAILDVGAGSAVWSLALCAAWPDASTTALDRPRVLDVARSRARSSGLADRLVPLVGDWRETALPERRFGVIVLANFCHLLSASELLELIAKLRPALSEQGRIVIIDSVPERHAGASVSTLRYDLALALRTTRGQVHDREGYRDALALAGLGILRTWTLARESGAFDVLLAGGYCGDPS